MNDLAELRDVLQHAIADAARGHRFFLQRQQGGGYELRAEQLSEPAIAAIWPLIEDALDEAYMQGRHAGREAAALDIEMNFENPNTCPADAKRAVQEWMQLAAMVARRGMQSFPSTIVVFPNEVLVT